MNYGYEYRATLDDGTPGGADVNMSMLVADVRAFAKLAPDFKYTHVAVRDEDGTMSSTCTYKPDEHNPLGCIVGAALREQGVVPGHDRSIRTLFNVHTQTHQYRLVCWLAEVQWEQDHGATWRDAVASANKFIPLSPRKR